ncbi:hypothetical protein [Salinispora arenicola]|uniref:hypothetical protein n=1 Tax=Salinispora arenicola TaxID=168697 RepID=UPI00036EF799|nr:hypothetical protein [Salinispora arenicola]
MEDRKRVTRSKDTKAQSRYSAAAARHQRHQRPLRPPLIDRAARAATAAYQRAIEAATTDRSQVWEEIHQLQKDVQRLQHEMRLLRKQVRRLPSVDQRRLIEVHLRDQLAAELEEMRREGYAEGYTDGIMRHRTDDLN